MTDEREESRATDEPVSAVFWPIWREAEGAPVVAVRDTAASLTYVFADTDGDNAIDTVVELTGLVTLAQTDFTG